MILSPPCVIWTTRWLKLAEPAFLSANTPWRPAGFTAIAVIRRRRYRNRFTQGCDGEEMTNDVWFAHRTTTATTQY